MKVQHVLFSALCAFTLLLLLQACIPRQGWSLTGTSGTTDGTHFIGTTDSVALDFRVNNARALRLEPHASSPNVVGGYSGNSVTGGIYGATISGGGFSGHVNQVTGDYGTIGGGLSNTASGTWATVPGGGSNAAAGGYSFAAGRRAKANHNGAFVWADVTDAVFASVAANQFLVRASGGTKFYSNKYATAGVSLAPGGSSWSSVSDQNLKANFQDEDGEAVLLAIADMPVPSWNYKSQDPSIRHLGPMAQDFYAAFGLGEDSLRINTVDIDGINLLAIHALEKRTRELAQLKAELAAVKAENAAMKTKMARFESALQRLEAATMAGEITDGGETTVAEVQE